MQDFKELFDNAPLTTEEDLNQLKQAAKDLENDLEFQQDLLKSLEEEKILKMNEDLLELSRNNL